MPRLTQIYLDNGCQNGKVTVNGAIVQTNIIAANTAHHTCMHAHKSF